MTVEQRIAMYNLYHLLNHANLFGGGYQQQSRSQSQRSGSAMRRQSAKGRQPRYS